MKYWIIINDTQIGPVDLDWLTHVQGFGPDTPVWREGLAEWTTAAQLPETAALLDAASASSPLRRNADGRPDPYVSTAGQYTYAPGSPQPTTEPPMPPNRLVWAILATLCCCLPTGIIAIIYASKVSPLYMRGDYEGSRSAAEKAELWVIISFVAGLIWAPFSVLWSLITA